jgi:hypothetical protein
VVLNVRKTMQLGGYRFDLHIEDLDLWWRMALAYDVVLIPEVTVEYRFNGQSVCVGNLREMNRNTLYAQYLLLSHLWRLPPFSLRAIEAELESLVDARRLRYREQMWQAAIGMSDKKYGRAAKHLAAAAASAPRRFLERAAYPMHKNRRIRVGESPELFRRAQTRLWPARAAQALAVS